MIHLTLNGSPTALRLEVADSFLTRLKGWMFRKGITNYDALLITPCNSVHTFGMRFCIDVAFVDGENKIIKLAKTLRPNRYSTMWRAKKCFEFREHTIDTLDLRLGDYLTAKEK